MMNNLIGKHEVAKAPDVKNIFNRTYYETQRGKAFDDVDHALEDYNEVGWRNGFRANPLFHERYYLLQNTDLGDGNLMSPLHHYVFHGSYEGRKPHPLFSFQKKKTVNTLKSWASVADYEKLPIDKRPKLSRFFAKLGTLSTFQT